MAVFKVLLLLALCMVLGTRGQTFCGSVFSVEEPLACCTTYTTANIMGEMCCKKDSKCLCTPTSNVYAQGIEGCPATTTAAPTTTTPPTTTAPPTTTPPTTAPPTSAPPTAAPPTSAPPTAAPPTAAPPTSAPPTAAPPTSAPPTTTTPPTTTLAPHCPIPTHKPGQRLLTSVLLNPCEDKGVVGFAWKGEFTNYKWAHLCNGVYLWDPNLNMRVIRTIQWCWKKVNGSLHIPDSEVQITHHGITFPVADIYWESITSSNYVTTLVVDKVLEAFLAYGRDPGIIFNSSCSNVACMYTEGMSMDYTDCYIASYGNNETNGGAFPDTSYRDKPNRVNVKSGGPAKICNTDDISNNYQLQIGSYCYVATEGGASCGETDTSAPLFCRTADTREDVLVHFTAPFKKDCDGAVHNFWAVNAFP